MVRENLNVSLKCSAKGYPKPSVKWRREDGRPVDWGNWQERKSLGLTPRKSLFFCFQTRVRSLNLFLLLLLLLLLTADVYEGETLTINRVSRLHMGAYLAIGKNFH